MSWLQFAATIVFLAILVLALVAVIDVLFVRPRTKGGDATHERPKTLTSLASHFAKALLNAARTVFHRNTSRSAPRE
jgi:hypothetical protein